MTALVNALIELPHHDGQLVLEAQRDAFIVQAIYRSGVYCIYGFVHRTGGGEWTRLAAERSTPRAAPDLAARAWAEGKDFDAIIG